MKLPLPVLDVDLLIEHDGHELKLLGSDMRFIAKFPTLGDVVHFSRILWPYRKLVPRESSVRVEWRGLSVPVKL